MNLAGPAHRDIAGVGAHTRASFVLRGAKRSALHDRLVQPGAAASVYHDIVDLVERRLVEEALLRIDEGFFA